MIHQATLTEELLTQDMAATARETAAKATGPEFDPPRPLSAAGWKKLPAGLKRVNEWLRSQGRPNQCPVEGGAA